MSQKLINASVTVTTAGTRVQVSASDIPIQTIY